MKVFDIFLKRQKRERGEVPDVYQYEIIPQPLRIQIVHIWQDALEKRYNHDPYEYIHKILCREYGVFTLGNSRGTYDELVTNFLLKTEKIEEAIDVIEVSFWYLARQPHHHLELSFDDAVAELNHRFQEHGVGYQYESGKIIRVDSQLIHSEVVRPAMSMLSDPMYQGANAEFLSAHEHYRKRRYKECLNDCLKAFESCLKAICEKRGWNYKSTDNAKRLIDIVFAHELIPNFMQSHFSALRNTLESGVPTVRNRMSGHGQGNTEVFVPESVAGYALHLTASNILLLGRADDELNF